MRSSKKEQAPGQEEVDKIFIKIFYVMIMILEGKMVVDNISCYIKKLKCVINEHTDPNATANSVYETLKKLGIWDTIGFMFSVKSFVTIIANTIDIIKTNNSTKKELKEKTEDIAVSYITSNFINLIVNSTKN